MTGEREDVFGSDEDLSDFTPKKPPPAPPVEAVRKVAEGAKFHSREPQPTQEIAKQPPPDRQEQRRYRTGRNVAFSTKVTQATRDDIDRLTDEAPLGQQVVGLTIERAIAALKRELAGQG